MFAQAGLLISFVGHILMQAASDVFSLRNKGPISNARLEDHIFESATAGGKALGIKRSEVM